MSEQHFNPDDDLLRRLDGFKRSPDGFDEFGPAVLGFFKQDVERKYKKLGRVADAWARLIPETLDAHCALESFHGGTLKVLVDSSSHLYELRQLLLAGVEQQLKLACKSVGLRKINLKAGRWYEGDGADRRIRFG